MNAPAAQPSETAADDIERLRASDFIAQALPAMSLEAANAEARALTGIRRFFDKPGDVKDFLRLVGRSGSPAPAARARDLGDFQTPAALARSVCAYLAGAGLSPEALIEPTYGAGAFILAALETFPRLQTVYGVEIQPAHEWQTKLALLARAVARGPLQAEIQLERGDIFTHAFPRDLGAGREILILGNPPWITNAALGALGSQNLPAKQNLKSLPGLDALTGQANFDIAEYILLMLLERFAQRRGTLAMLCKTATVKNIIAALPQKRFPIANMRALEIDAPRDFGAAVSACLFVAELGAPRRGMTCSVAALAQPENTLREFGWVGERLVSNVRDYRALRRLDGASPYVWRQGLKHDCAPVMELTAAEGGLINGLGGAVDVEAEHIFWLLKGSDLGQLEAPPPRKMVIVTQRALGEDTTRLAATAPRLWQYLNDHSDYFARRKSSIYRNKPPFSMFGVGGYSFKPYKVAISGLHKQPNFCIVGPVAGRPVMLDDTCYFAGFDSYVEALLTATILNSEPVQRLLAAIAFPDAKRPYTKNILMRIDLARAAEEASPENLRRYWAGRDYQLREPIAADALARYAAGLRARQSSQPRQLALEV